MHKVDINKYVDLEMEYSFKGGNGYMIAPDIVTKIIETEMAVPYEYIPMCINDSKLNLSESKIKKYCLTRFLKYNPQALEYYRKMIRVYKYRAVELLEIIDLLGHINDGTKNEVANRKRLSALAEYYDLMINRNGEIYYKDLERILNPFFYNIYNLLKISTEANNINNYSKNPQVESYPVMSLQSNDMNDEGLIPLTENQKKMMRGNQKKITDKEQICI